MFGWEVLEERVRTIASYIWNASAEPEVVHGVKCDAVLKPDVDRWIVLEVTKSGTLDKLRTDLSKFAVIKPALIAEGIHTSCYFVTAEKPTDSLIATAKAVGVTALSVGQLQKLFFDYERYRHVRTSKPFGSAVDPSSGEKDLIPYVPVRYVQFEGKKSYTIAELVRALRKQKRIVLLGHYGTGKSRCVQETFMKLSEVASEQNLYPLAVDLRAHWGLRRATEIVRRHFEDLGLSHNADSALRVMDKGALTLLLDGFDEIASQVWSDDPKRLEEIRVQSLMGVADLVRSSRGGVLISGREHYFNSNEEMFRCLGLQARNTLVVCCAEEFSEEQMRDYLSVVGPDVMIPTWLPKRPLVSKMLTSFDRETLHSLSGEDGEVDFWYRLLDAICQREARIHPSLDAGTIRRVLLELAHLSRRKGNNVGPLTLRELNDAFEKVVGRPPRDEASAMLQRLPMLGRADASGSDRQFLDTYILDGLRATAVAEMMDAGPPEKHRYETWLHPLGVLGQAILTQSIVDHGDSSRYLRYVRQLAESGNRVLAGDIVTALFGAEGVQTNFGNMVLAGSHLGTINLAETGARHLTIRDSFIDEMTVGTNAPTGVTVENCIITTVRGLSTSDRLPEWLVEPEIDRFDALANVARIREAGLSKEQEIFVTVVHKTFFQPGSGRKEEALLRGLGAAGDRKIARRVLGMLIDEGVLTSFPGQEGSVYTPVRKHTTRMGQIVEQLRYSSDPLWTRL